MIDSAPASGLAAAIKAIKEMLGDPDTPEDLKSGLVLGRLILETRLAARLAAPATDLHAAVEALADNPPNDSALGRALRRRVDDWFASTSEFYARDSGDHDRWREGLVGYLLRGTDSSVSAFLRALLADHPPVPPCGSRCPGECGWNPDDPDDPCAALATTQGPDTGGG